MLKNLSRSIKIIKAENKIVSIKNKFKLPQGRRSLPSQRASNNISPASKVIRYIKFPFSHRIFKIPLCRSFFHLVQTRESNFLPSLFVNFCVRLKKGTFQQILLTLNVYSVFPIQSITNSINRILFIQTMKH